MTGEDSSDEDSDSVYRTLLTSGGVFFVGIVVELDPFEILANRLMR